MRRGLTNILVMLVVVTSLAAAPQSSDPSFINASENTPSNRQETNSKPHQTGKASWYGKFFHGRPTASGEPYDMFLFTAAHRTLPLGTRMKVTNLSNGRSVIVRVNDRGPVPLSRVVDLSYAAAQVLGFRQGGIGRVRLDVLEKPPVVALGAGQSAGMP